MITSAHRKRCHLQQDVLHQLDLAPGDALEAAGAPGRKGVDAAAIVAAQAPRTEVVQHAPRVLPQARRLSTHDAQNHSMRCTARGEHDMTVTLPCLCQGYQQADPLPCPEIVLLALAQLRVQTLRCCCHECRTAGGLHRCTCRLHSTARTCAGAE